MNIYKTGIYGMIVSKKIDSDWDIRQKIFNGLALSLGEKNNNSTGLCTVNDKAIYSLRLLKPSIKAIRSKAYSNLLVEKKPRIVMGITESCNYTPTSEDDVRLFIDNNIYGTTQGDIGPFVSKDIFKSLSEENNDYKKVFSKEISNNYIITWVDKTKPTIVYLANAGDGDLWIASLPQLKTFFWCTKYYPLNSVLTSMGTNKFTSWQIPKKTVYEIDTQLKIRKYNINFRFSFNTKPIKKLKEFVYDIFDSIDEIKEEREKGCIFCSANVKKDIGFYWHEKTKFIICNKCQKAMTAKTSLDYILTKDYEEKISKRPVQLLLQ